MAPDPTVIRSLEEVERFVAVVLIHIHVVTRGNGPLELAHEDVVAEPKKLLVERASTVPLEP